MLKNFLYDAVSLWYFLTSDFFHTCVAAHIMEELSRLSCIQGYHAYQDARDASYWRMNLLNVISVNISWDLIL